MDVSHKFFTIAAILAAAFAQYGLLPANAHADDQQTAAAATLTAGYSEKYSFKINGKSIGEQSATLVKVDNGVQTWKFDINLQVPINTQTYSLKQTGTYVLASDYSPLSLDTVAVANGATQSEKLIFSDTGVNVTLDPVQPEIASSIPVLGRPHLLVNNLVSLVSLATRATFAKQVGAYSFSVFSGTVLRQVFVSLKPSADQQAVNSPFRVFDATMSAPGLPDTINQYYLSSTTGELLRCTDRAQGLEITKE
jgi:hypothetical protein